MSKVLPLNCFPAAITNALLGGYRDTLEGPGGAIKIDDAQILFAPHSSVRRFPHYHSLVGCQEAFIKLDISGPLKSLYTANDGQIEVKLWRSYPDPIGPEVTGTKFDWSEKQLKVKFTDKSATIVAPIGLYWNRLVQLAKASVDVYFTVHVGEKKLKSAPVKVPHGPALGPADALTTIEKFKDAADAYNTVEADTKHNFLVSLQSTDDTAETVEFYLVQ